MTEPIDATHRPASAHSWLNAHGLAHSFDHLAKSAASEAATRLHDYTSLVMRWNRTYNLTGARNEADFLTDHLADSLAAIPIIAGHIDLPHSLVIDLGSGAGLPGVPLAIAHPDLQVALVEPVGKKAAFLRQAIATCGLRNAFVHACRMDQALPALAAVLAGSGRQPHFTSRAFASLDRLISETAPIATPASRLFALKSRSAEDELAGLAPGHLVALHPIADPTHQKHRCVVELAPAPLPPIQRPSNHSLS